MNPNDARRCRSRALVCALLLVTLHRPAAAAGRDEAGARALFAEGRRLVDAGQYADACSKFEESLKLDPGVGTSFNLADCEERIGKTASSWARFLDVAAATKAEGQQEKERVARARAAALEPKLARLVIEVAEPVEGLSIERDGLPIGAGAWGLPVPVDPGTHVVEARGTGRSGWSQEVSVPAGPVTIAVLVPELEREAPRPAREKGQRSDSKESVPAARARETAGPRRFTWPVVTLGAVATASLVSGAVFAWKLRSENEEAKSLCPDSLCQSEAEKARHDGLVEDAHRDRTVAFVSAGVGTAALMTAAYLWWRPARPSPPKAAPTGWVIRPMTSGLGADLAVTW